MSNQDIDKSSWKDRFKPHIKTALVSFVAGAAFIAVVRHSPKSLITPVDGVWFHPELIKQISERGAAVIEVPTTGRIVDIIDWSHPLQAAKEVV